MTKSLVSLPHGTRRMNLPDPEITSWPKAHSFCAEWETQPPLSTSVAHPLHRVASPAWEDFGNSNSMCLKTTEQISTRTLHVQQCETDSGQFFCESFRLSTRATSLPSNKPVIRAQLPSGFFSFFEIASFLIFKDTLNCAPGPLFL